MPGAGHLVHMPSHIYQRVGRYQDSAEANRRAIAADKRYVDKARPEGFYAMYVAHNRDFLRAAALMNGRSAEALEAARATVASLPLEMFRQMPGFDFVLASPSLVLTRFGRWEEVLREPAPPDEFKLATAIDHYARARALIGLGRLDEAQKQIDALETAGRALPKDLMAGMAPASLMIEIADDVARGEVLIKRGRVADGIKKLEAAVLAADRLPYAEPPDWYYPPRQTLGARLLEAKRFGAAEAVYREDLKRNPSNGWSLIGLRAALRGQKKAIAAVEAQLASAWSNADVKPESSDF
jgi:tetratricopeptide (TPR) repeat protein